MGVVYLASHDQWKVDVAIKVPHGVWISPHHRAVFEAEQQSLARLVHTNIARIFDGRTLEDGTPWFAMEYVEGERITAYCERESLPLHDRLQAFPGGLRCSTVRSLERSDSSRPEAVQHSGHRPRASVKLLDFGIAKQMSEGVDGPASTKTGLNPLTRAYSAPEQFSRGEVSSETDVYALGVILHETH